MPIVKEQIRQIISENNISSIADVYALFKDSFKEILQELMEAELDASLEYEKNQKGLYPLTTRETDILQRLSKASMENSRLIFPGTARENLNQNSFLNTSAIFPASRKK